MISGLPLRGLSTPGQGQGKGPAGDKFRVSGTQETVEGAGANEVSGVLEEASYCRCEAPSMGIVLHPHLSHLNIVLHCIQHLLSIGDSQNLEFHIPEVDRVEGIVLPCDDDGSLVDWCADFEADAIVREEDELGGVPDAEHLGSVSSSVSEVNQFQTKVIGAEKRHICARI